jgi:hypothetical protein
MSSEFLGCDGEPCRLDKDTRGRIEVSQTSSEGRDGQAFGVTSFDLIEQLPERIHGLVPDITAVTALRALLLPLDVVRDGPEPGGRRRR